VEAFISELNAKSRETVLSECGPDLSFVGMKIDLSSNHGLVMVHFPSYAPPHGHAKASSQYRNCTSGRTGFSLSSDLDNCDVPEAAVRARSLVDVVGYALGVRRLDILLVNGCWSVFPDSHMVSAMDFPDRRVAIFHTRSMVFFL
jgi:hypothetical protein